MSNTETKDTTTKTDAQWRAELTPEQYRILREAGTGRSCGGGVWDGRRPGTYRRAGCGQELFQSAAKFEPGAGWPGFFEPAAPGAVATDTDRSYGMTRTEALCSACGGHLGHVFD